MRTRSETRASRTPIISSVRRRVRGSIAAFTLAETMVALSVVSVGFLGAFAMVLQGGKLASAAEEEALVCSALEQRMDQLRSLDWTPLTDGSGLTGTVFTARAASVSNITVSQETITISPYALAGAKTLTGSWVNAGVPSTSFSAGTQSLSADVAVKAVASITWTGRRSGSTQTRSLTTVIAKGGVSQSALP